MILNVWRRTGKIVLFITHSVEEAVFLASKLIVMTPRPGKIEKTYDLDFSRSYLASGDVRAVKSDPQFIRTREDVLAYIRRDAPEAAASA